MILFVSPISASWSFWSIVYQTKTISVVRVSYSLNIRWNPCKYQNCLNVYQIPEEASSVAITNYSLLSSSGLIVSHYEYMDWFCPLIFSFLAEIRVFRLSYLLAASSLDEAFQLASNSPRKVPCNAPESSGTSSMHVVHNKTLLYSEDHFSVVT